MTSSQFLQDFGTSGSLEAIEEHVYYSKVSSTVNRQLRREARFTPVSINININGVMLSYKRIISHVYKGRIHLLHIYFETLYGAKLLDAGYAIMVHDPP